MTSRERSRSRDKPAEIHSDVAKAMHVQGVVLERAVNQLIHDLDTVEFGLAHAMTRWASDAPWPWVLLGAEKLDDYMRTTAPVLLGELDGVFALERNMHNSTAR
jgi:hypothetical protein